MNFHKYKRWLGVGILAIVCAISPQMVNADTVPEPDGVMGQSVTEEMQADPAKDYVLLSAGLNEQPIDTEMMPLLRASAYSALFTDGSFTTVSDLNGSTYYHDNAYADCEIINGIDVSWWQGGGRGSTTSKINWQKMHDAGTDFVFVRAASRDTSDASIYEDTTASAHINGAQANDMNVGLYIFSQAINEDEAVEEADYVLNLIDQYGWDIDMPIFIDREAGRQTKRLTNAKLSKAKETAVVQAFADEITAAGYKAGVYASYSWYNNKMNADDLSDCAIWIARYNNTTTSNTKSGTPYADVLCDYEFWQYSSTKPSSPTGYTGNLDKNFWYKDTKIKTENLKTSKITGDAVALTWDDAGDAEMYRVYRYNEETGKYGYLGTVSDTTYTDKNLQAGTQYKYKVRCMWTIGGNNYFGTYSSVVSAVTLPAKVENVSISGRSSTKITLTWDAAGDVSGYRILQHNSDSDTYEEIASVGADVTSYEVAKLASASVYCFKVQAHKTADAQTSLGDLSDEVVAVTKPGKGSGLAIEATGSATIELTWKKTARADGYQIYRLDEASGKYVKLATIKGNEIFTYTDSGLFSARTYSYKVRAYKTYEKKNYYGSFSAVTTQTTKPEKVKGVKLTTKASSVTIKWNKAEGVTGYQVYRLNAKTKKYEKIATVKGESKISYTNKKLKKGSTYSYKVRAYKTVEGNEYFGSYSAVVKIKVK